MELWVKHLGWIIPHYVTGMQGQRWRQPGRGRCTECAERKPRVYVLGNGDPYCSDCIMFDLAEASPSDEMKHEQRHPPTFPIETIYERVKQAVNDGADLRVYEEAFR